MGDGLQRDVLDCVGGSRGLAGGDFWILEMKGEAIMLSFAAESGELIKSLQQISAAVNGNWPPSGLSDWVSFTTIIVALVSIIMAFISVALTRNALKKTASQIKQMEDQHGVEVFFFISKLLGDEELRMCRQVVYHNRKKVTADWSAADEKTARRVVAAFEAAFTASEKAEWARNKLISNWGQQIVKAYESTRCLITKWREEEDASQLFKEFIDLGRMACAAEEKRCSNCNV